MDGGEQQMGAAEAVAAGLHYSSARISALLQGRQTYALDGDYSERELWIRLSPDAA